MSLVELKRIFGEWRTRLQRAYDVLQPEQWSEHDWHHFSRALYTLVKRYGNSWAEEGSNYWDIRWALKEGGELICQVEEKDSCNTLVVAQSGGFAEGVDCYTWFYGEYDKEGNFMAEPYWVDGNWKEALSMILLPHQMAAGFYLSNSSVPLNTLLLGDADKPEGQPEDVQQAHS